MNEPAYKKVEEGWKRKMSLPPLRMPINAGVLRDWWKMEENFKKNNLEDDGVTCPRVITASREERLRVLGVCLNS